MNHPRGAWDRDSSDGERKAENGPDSGLGFDPDPPMVPVHDPLTNRQLRIREYIGEAAAVGKRAGRVLNVHQIVAEKAELRHWRTLWAFDRVAKHA